MSVPSAADRRLLPEGRLAGPMPWVIAIMMFLTALAAATGLAMGTAAARLDRSLTGRVTVQVVVADPAVREAQARAVEAALRRQPGVGAVTRVGRPPGLNPPGLTSHPRRAPSRSPHRSDRGPGGGEVRSGMPGRDRRDAAMTIVRPLAALVAGSLILASPVLAQTTVTRSKTVASGKTVRLEIAPNLKKDCSPGPMPEFKVSGAPKNGSVITKVGKLKTPASYRCPNKEAAVQALFYQPNAGYTGPDEVTFEVKSSDGQVQTQNIKITVGAASAKPDADAKKEGTDL